jgi:hypothetical protein
MVASNVLDPDLFHRAAVAKRDAAAFLAQHQGTVNKLVVRISEDQLREAAQSEAKRATNGGTGSITLSNLELTPGMSGIDASVSEQYSAWKGNVDKHFATLNSVISDIRHEANKIKDENLPEVETAKAKLLARADRDFEDTVNYKQNREEYNGTKGRFERLRMLNNNVSPKRRAKSFYVLALILVGLGDMYINYGVFLSKFETAIAIIVTAFVGFVFAVASHVHGKMLKQYKSLSQNIEDIDEKEKQGEVRVFWIATSVLFVCLAAILWARSDYFMQGSGLDFSLENLPFVFSRIGPTAFFNFLIWFVGSTISFWYHERVPGLRETHARWVELDANLDELRVKLKDDKRKIEVKHEVEGKALEGRLAECEGQLTNLNASKEQLGKLDQNFLVQISAQRASLLRKYAQALCAQIVEIEHDPSSMVLVSPRRGRLTLSEFEASDFQAPWTV